MSIDLTKLNVPSDALLLDAFFSTLIDSAASAADELGIFDCLSHAPLSDSQIASQLNLHAPGVLALCRLLVSNQLLQTNEAADLFTLTPVAQAYWCKQSPLYRGVETFYQKELQHHKRIVEGLKHQRADNEITEMWKQGTLNESTAQHFTDLMHSIILGPSIMEVRSGAFDNIEHIIDAGGGSGAFCAAFSAHYPEKKTTVLDLEPVLEASRKYVARYHVQHVEFVACNFFSPLWPSHGDAYHFSNILHDWPVPVCQQFLKKAHQALPSGGQIFVHEALLNEDKVSPPTTVAFNLSMYLNHGAQQFTYSQLSELLQNAGFAHIQKVHSFGYYSLINATKK